MKHTHNRRFPNLVYPQATYAPVGISHIRRFAAPEALRIKRESTETEIWRQVLRSRHDIVVELASLNGITESICIAYSEK
jgi:hypothetical protein